jgi:hypothetical protein
MKLTVDLGKVQPENLGTLWASDVLEEYRLYDVDYLFHDRKAEPLQRLEQAEILAVFFTADMCRFVVCGEAAGKWVCRGRNTHGKYVSFGNTEALKEAMAEMGAEIETGPEEYPEVEDLLAAFANAIGITNIAIARRRKETE